MRDAAIHAASQLTKMMSDAEAMITLPRRDEAMRESMVDYADSQRMCRHDAAAMMMMLPEMLVS